MFPDKPQQQAGMPASLPANLGQPQGLDQFAAASSTVDAAQQAGIQTKALVSQYQQNPYQLSQAFQQLKSHYLADHFHITANPMDK